MLKSGVLDDHLQRKTPDFNTFALGPSDIQGAVAHSQGRLAAPGIGGSQARSSAPPGRGSRFWAETTRGGLASRPWLWTSAPSGRNSSPFKSQSGKSISACSLENLRG